MNGYQLSFFTRQDRSHAGRPMVDWLLDEARAAGAAGATVFAASAGFGHHGRMHSAHFFELADQPVEVVVALGPGEAERLLTRLRDEGIDIFYVKTPAEFGTTGSGTGAVAPVR